MVYFKTFTQYLEHTDMFTKMQQACDKNKLTQENYKQTHIPVTFSLAA